jgi:hypothetical protein
MASAERPFAANRTILALSTSRAGEDFAFTRSSKILRCSSAREMTTAWFGTPTSSHTSHQQSRNFVDATLEALWVSEGQALARAHREGLCRTQLTVALDDQRLTELLREPLGNHLVVVPGHHADHLREWWELMVPVGMDRAA